MANLIYKLFLIFINDFLIFILAGFALVFTFVKNKLLFVKLLLTIFFVYITDSLIKNLIMQKRPFEISGTTPQILFIPQDSTFPSSHAAFSAAIAFTLYFSYPKLGYFMLFSAILVSLGRVLANVHYPIDVVAGFIIGLIYASLIHIFLVNRSTKKKNQRNSRS